MPEGYHVIDDVSNAPFGLHVRKMNHRRPGILVGRFPPEDDSLASRIRRLLGKANKLLKYQQARRTTVLLLDGWDFILMNEWIMINAIQDAYPDGLPKGVDQIWYADTSEPRRTDFADLTPELHAIGAH